MKKSRGIALATLFMLVPLLLVLILALFLALNAGTGWSGKQYGQTSAHLVAEAGLAHALLQLEADPDWDVGLQEVPMANTGGSYTVIFNQSGSGFSSSDSVNNRDGMHPDSILGADSVPAGMILLTVVGKVGAHEVSLRYLLGAGQTVLNLNQAILTSGKIRMKGDVSVSGVASLDDVQSVNADIQTNSQATGEPTILWEPDGGSIEILGEVRSASTASDSVDLGGYDPAGGIHTGNPASPPPAIDIVGSVRGQRGATPLLAGNTTVPAGESYYDASSGPLQIDGDLVLEGDLYVEGDLEVNGSISGTGSVYVTGNSSFRGDAKINGQNNVSLLSHGHVVLRGFDGDAYLNNIAATDTGSDFSIWLEDSRWALGEVESRMLGGSWSGFDIGIQDVSSVLGPQNTAWNSDYPGRTGGSLWRMRDRLQDMPAGPTRDFMIKKLDETGAIFVGNGNILGESDTQTRDRFLDTGDPAGLLDAANDLATDMGLKRSVFGITEQISNDKLGSSYFQGMIYTNGAFVASNQVSILGALAVIDNGTQPPLDLDGETYEPGELVLQDGVNLRFIEEAFTGANAPSAPGPPEVKLFFGGSN